MVKQQKSVLVNEESEKFINEKQINNSRIYFLDLLKIIAIFFVLYNHRGLYNYTPIISSFGPVYLLFSTLSIICKMACPLFFMVSGAMLLKKDETFKQIFIHRILRILIIILLCSLWMSVDNFTINNIFNNLLYHQNWYIYAYLAFLIMLPFFRAMVKSMNKYSFILYFVLCLILYQIPLFINSSLFINNMVLFSTNSLSSACWHIVFPILGYYFMNLEKLNFSKKEIKIQYFIIIGLMIFEFIIGYVFIYKDIVNNYGYNVERFNQILCILPACFIFYSFKLLSNKIQNCPKFLLKAMYYISISSFGIYLIDVYTKCNIKFIDALSNIFIPYIGAFITNILGILIIMVIETILVVLLKKIPYIKKLL